MKYVCPEKGRAQRGNLKYLEDLRGLSKNNRKNYTEAEKIFWRIVGKNKLGYRFLRQKPIGRFIADFYCSKLLLVIEIDGDYHRERKNYDDGRDEMLANRGILTIRYKNTDILDNLNWVRNDLIERIEKRKGELIG